MAVTYEPIATYTFTSDSSSYTFSSIPGTYTDLVLIGNYGVTTDDDVNLNVNGDTTSGLYSYTKLYGTGSSAVSNRGSAQNKIQYGIGNVTVPTTLTSNAVTHFMNYANTSVYKTILHRANEAQAETLAEAGLWRNTNAITSITVKANLSNIKQNSTFTLYGIKAA